LELNLYIHVLVELMSQDKFKVTGYSLDHRDSIPSRGSDFSLRYHI